jgi:hypothetical protein
LDIFGREAEDELEMIMRSRVYLERDEEDMHFPYIPNSMDGYYGPSETMRF